MPFIICALIALISGMAMDAHHQLVNFGSGPAAALPQVITLIVLAVIIGFFAARTSAFSDPGVIFVA